MSTNYLFTSESVSEGHPDKLADQISDAILDAIIAQDPNARVACETYVKTGFVLVGGEITTSAWVDVENIVREKVNAIGYINSALGFDGNACAILNTIGRQSTDIAMGVDTVAKKEQGAGDQGMMFGFACNETDVLMPATIFYAHRLVQRQADLRHRKVLPWLRPDGKSQITLHYKNSTPVSVDSVVLSTQHDPDIAQSDLVEAVIEEIIKPTLPENWITKDTKFYVNPTGRFVIGGPQGDCGLTGRKIIVDSYGGMARHGGGAFSGKDPSKVDRSGAYCARYIAKNIVAAGLADRCEVQLSYAIGIANPVSIYVNTFGTSKIPEAKICNLIKELFPLKPRQIIDHFQLLRPIYTPTAVYGHFGRSDVNFPWEALDKCELLRDELK